MKKRSTKKLLWFQSGSCGGCTLSTLGSQSPDFLTALENIGIELLWHPSLSDFADKDLISVLKSIINDEITIDIFCLEGSVIQGPNGSGKFHYLSGTGEPAHKWIKQLAEKAKMVLAIGSCAAFGGIPAAGGNHIEATGLQYFNEDNNKGLLANDFKSIAQFPVINIAGCPTHPDWVINTLSMIAADSLTLEELDEFSRPRFYTDYLVHHGCPRNEFYEFKAAAEKMTDMGCLMENMGCLGTQARADCNINYWNGSGSCLKGGFACINCTAPGFEEKTYSFTKTKKIAGIPVGLPTDMPKAWFVALASLAKAATPKRLRENSTSDKIKIKPGQKGDS